MGGQGFVWLLNASAMTDVASIAKYSHADESAVNFGVLQTGAVGLAASAGKT